MESGNNNNNNNNSKNDEFFQKNFNSNSSSNNLDPAFAKSKLKSLDELNFDNSSLKKLPLDPIEKNYVRRSVANTCFSLVAPTPVENPKLVCMSEEALKLLDLDPNEAKKPEFAEYFGGNKLLKGSQTAAHCYCGFQFGYFSGQLGDGRAMYLGEIVNQKQERWELQLKGAGKTPYSRDGDGRAVLRSSIREFLCSEAMFHLGVPTTRAGTLVTSDTIAIRDIKYDGNPIKEKATLVLRIAPTFLRFGSFQISLPMQEDTGRIGPSANNLRIIKKLLEFTLENYYPHLQQKEFEEKVAAFFEELTIKTARMVAEWQCVGFAHGVLNTDNMSIVGVTIDYGPFGFVEDFDQDFICNASDNGGRYSFKNQPSICRWNLKKLAEALQAFLDLDKAEEILKKYDKEFDTYYLSKMRRKLGLQKKELPEDEKLVQDLLQAMQDSGADFTLTFRDLHNFFPFSFENLQTPNQEASAFTKHPSFESTLKCILSSSLSYDKFLKRSQPKLQLQQLQALLHIAQTNPEMLAMIGQDPEALLLEMKRFENYQNLKKTSQAQKTENDKKIWTQWLERYALRLFQEISSEKVANKEQFAELQTKKSLFMKSQNPKFILRNWIAQQAIEKAEKGDFSLVQQLLQILKHPYADEHPFDTFAHDKAKPEWADDLCVT